jgi:hypothetical protein
LGLGSYNTNFGNSSFTIYYFLNILMKNWGFDKKNHYSARNGFFNVKIII